jgi:hypothetical protein
MAVKTTPRLDTAEITRVMRQHDTGGDPDVFGWIMHQSAEDLDHVLISCDMSGTWQRTMPGNATRQAIMRHLARYTDSLRAAGFGTAAWSWYEKPRVLIVAADQATADEIAPGIREHLTELNPEPEERP